MMDGSWGEMILSMGLPTVRNELFSTVNRGFQ